MIVAAAILIVMSSGVETSFDVLEVARDSSTSLGMTETSAVARSAFDDYLFRREGTGGLGFFCGFWVDVARIIFGGLQQLDSWAGQTGAPGPAVFAFVRCKNPHPSPGTFRVREIFYSSVAGFA